MGILIENVSALVELRGMGVEWVTPGAVSGLPFPSLRHLTHGSPCTLVTISKPTFATVYTPHSYLSAPEDLRQHITMKTWPPP